MNYTLCKCPCFHDIKKVYIDKHYYNKPNIYKLTKLLKVEDENTLIKLRKFIKLAFIKRKKKQC